MNWPTSTNGMAVMQEKLVEDYLLELTKVREILRTA